MAIGWSFGKTRLADRARHFGRDIAQPFKDIGNGFRSMGVSAGFYTKAVDAFADLSASSAAGEGAGEKCSYRQVLLKILLGLGGSAPKGVKQSLEKNENKYDSITIENAIADLKEQKAAVDKLTEKNTDTEIKRYISSYEQTLKGKVKKSLKGTSYRINSDKLEKDLKEVLEESKTASKDDFTKRKDKKIKELDKELKSKEKESNDATKVRTAFQDAHDDLEAAMTIAESFVKPFGKKTEAAQKRFREKANKMQSVIEGCKPKEGREASEIKKIEEASKSAEKALRALVTLQGAQVASYRRVTETLIDAWIDLHRLVEKHNSTDPVISERYQKVILLIRKENRTYFLKETIDEKKKIKNVSEDAADKITDELDKGTISKKGSKLALEKSGGK